MYSRPHHQCIQRVLESLDDDLLRQHHCLFGGGTAIVLARGEYRESVDIDFIVSSLQGYRALRGLVNTQGIGALMTRSLPLRREAKIDQYGIRSAVDVDGVPVKLEIVFEGRVALADPLPAQRICGVWALALEDQVATKLMANSDRWADRAVWSRDVIDLAMLVNDGQLDPTGVAKALRAYGSSVITDLDKARSRLLADDGWLAACMARLQMSMAESALREKLVGLSVAV